MPVITNQIWRIDARDGRRFVLRRLPEYLPGVGPVEQYRVLAHLTAAGIPVATPIVTDAGGINATVDDQTYELLPYLPSDRGNHELGPDAAATAHAIGTAIARLDAALAACPWAVSSFIDDPAPDILGTALPALPDEVRRLVEPLAERLWASTAGLPLQRTHGDCNTGNVLVHDGRVSGFIDLDHLPLGPRVRDLSYYLASRLQAHFVTEAPARRDIDAMLAVLGDYVAGYHHAAPLSDRERAAVVPLLLLVTVGGANWCLNGWEPNPAGYRQNLRTLVWITDHLDDLTDAAHQGSTDNAVDAGAAR